MCVSIGGRICFSLPKKKKIPFVFTAKGFFFPFPFQESSQAIVFLCPRGLGLPRESRCWPEASFILCLPFFVGCGGSETRKV